MHGNECLLISIYAFFNFFNCTTIFATNHLAVHHPQHGPRSLRSALMIISNSTQQMFAEGLLCRRKCLGAGDTAVTRQPAKTPPAELPLRWGPVQVGLIRLHLTPCWSSIGRSGNSKYSEGFWGSMSLLMPVLFVGLTPA